MATIDRVAIYNRDGGMCGICGEAVAFADLDVDHVIHRWRGGPSTPDNMRTTHRWCNRRRGPRENPPDSDGSHLTFSITPELNWQLQSFRHEHRFPSRAAAVRWLLEAELQRQLSPKREGVV